MILTMPPSKEPIDCRIRDHFHMQREHSEREKRDQRSIGFILISPLSRNGFCACDLVRSSMEENNDKQRKWRRNQNPNGEREERDWGHDERDFLQWDTSYIIAE